MSGKKFAKGKSNLKPDDTNFRNIEAFKYDEKFLQNVVCWIAFWREYPFHFCKYYLGINLKPFQCVLLYQMMHNNNFCFIASRGLKRYVYVNKSSKRIY